MVKVPPKKFSMVPLLAGVSEPVTTTVTVPKPAVVELAAVFVTVTLPMLDVQGAGNWHLIFE